MEDEESYSGVEVYELRLLCLQRGLGNWGWERELLGRLRLHDMQQRPDPKWDEDSDPSGIKWRQEVDKKYEKLNRASDALVATEVEYYNHQLQASKSAGEERKNINGDHLRTAYREHEKKVQALKEGKEKGAKENKQAQDSDGGLKQSRKGIAANVPLVVSVYVTFQ